MTTKSTHTIHFNIFLTFYPTNDHHPHTPDPHEIHFNIFPTFYSTNDHHPHTPDPPFLQPSPLLVFRVKPILFIFGVLCRACLENLYNSAFLQFCILSSVLYFYQVCIVPVQLIHTTRQLTSVSIELPTRGFSWKEIRIQ